MATDEQVRTFFQAAAPRAAELRAQYRVGWPASLAGGSIGCLVPMAVLVTLIARGNEWSKESWFAPAAIGAGVGALACVLIGSRIYQRGQKLFEPVDARVDDELIRPFAALVIEGATLEFPDDSILEWRASLLFPRRAHVHAMHGKTNRLTGRIAGLAAVLDEMVIRFRNDNDARTFDGWVVRLHLPFAVGGHLRIRVPTLGYESLLIQEGLARLDPEAERLGTGHGVDVAPPGVMLEWAEAPTPSGLPAEALLTDTVVDALREHPKLEVAASGHTLWVTVGGVRAFDNRRNVACFDADFGRRITAKIRAVETIARAFVSAGG